MSLISTVPPLMRKTRSVAVACMAAACTVVLSRPMPSMTRSLLTVMPASVCGDELSSRTVSPSLAALIAAWMVVWLQPLGQTVTTLPASVAWLAAQPEL